MTNPTPSPEDGPLKNPVVNGAVIGSTALLVGFLFGASGTALFDIVHVGAGPDPVEVGADYAILSAVVGFLGGTAIGFSQRAKEASAQHNYVGSALNRVGSVLSTAALGAAFGGLYAAVRPELSLPQKTAAVLSFAGTFAVAGAGGNAIHWMLNRSAS